MCTNSKSIASSQLILAKLSHLCNHFVDVKYAVYATKILFLRMRHSFLQLPRMLALHKLVPP